MKLSRRTVLRGLGTAVALPFLEAMSPGRASAAGAPPLRFIGYMTPNGFRPERWASTAGPGGILSTLSPTLASLDDLRSHLTVVQGLQVPHALPEGTGAHHRGVSGFLTAASCIAGTSLKLCVDPQAETCAPFGLSFDQHLAASIPRAAFRSLELGPSNTSISASRCGADPYPCAYVDNISWIDATTPAGRETSAIRAFNRLFGGASSGETQQAIALRKTRRLSVLDFVREDAATLQSRLGTGDRRRVEEYMAGIRELEQRVSASEPSMCAAPTTPTIHNAGARGRDIAQYVTLMQDIMVTALRCDRVRVATFMRGGGGNAGTYDYENILSGHGLGATIEQTLHHDLSHWNAAPMEDQGHALEALALIEEHQVAQFGDFLRKLRAAQDSDGTSVLDNSVVYFSSELSDGAGHLHSDLPVVLAGGLGGRLRGNRCLERPGAALGDLFVSLSEAFGAPLGRFGNGSTGPLPGLI